MNYFDTDYYKSGCDLSLVEVLGHQLHLGLVYGGQNKGLALQQQSYSLKIVKR